ncbi:hypothetical protein [Microcystis aeruginosa]|nr:hypothetical protein [Microcystis aeruginosa]WNF14735.1 hypothetical protein RKE53_22465 [Microcystis aeruginosa NRERC-214]
MIDRYSRPNIGTGFLQNRQLRRLITTMAQLEMWEEIEAVDLALLVFVC